MAVTHEDINSLITPLIPADSGIIFAAQRETRRAQFIDGQWRAVQFPRGENVEFWHVVFGWDMAHRQNMKPGDPETTRYVFTADIIDRDPEYVKQCLTACVAALKGKPVAIGGFYGSLKAIQDRGTIIAPAPDVVAAAKTGKLS